MDDETIDAPLSTEFPRMVHRGDDRMIVLNAETLAEALADGWTRSHGQVSKRGPGRPRKTDVE